MTRKQRRATRVREKRVGRQALDVDYLGLADGHTYWVVYEQQADISSGMTPSGHLMLENGEDTESDETESESDSDNKNSDCGGDNNDDSNKSDDTNISDGNHIGDEAGSKLDADMAAVRQRWLALARQNLSHAHSRLDAQSIDLSSKIYVHDNHRCVCSQAICMYARMLRSNSCNFN